MDNSYKVVWGRPALRSLGQLFNIQHEKVYKQTRTLLSRNPAGQSYGSADYPDFPYNGYHWTFIHNTIIVYRISEQDRSVFIDACYHANTEWALQVLRRARPIRIEDCLPEASIPSTGGSPFAAWPL